MITLYVLCYFSQCPVCHKRVMNNSAMACHMKTHSDRKYYDCPVCGQDFDMAAGLKEHGLLHSDADGRLDTQINRD